MAEFVLCSEQVELLHKYVREFQEWLKTPVGKKDVKEHRDHESFFKTNLSPKNIEKMTEDELREIYKKLWASEFFSNKDWIYENRIMPNGIENIKKELIKFLYGTEDLSVRYDEFRSNIKGFGPSSLTEILHFIFPESYCLWNKKPMRVLPFLKLDKLPEKFFKTNFTRGEEYLQIVNALRVIKDELREFGINDFIDLDVFFWYLSSNIISKKKTRQTRPDFVKKSKIEIDSHEAAEFYLLELGNMLGYDTYTVDKSKFYGEKRLGDVAILEEIYPIANASIQNVVSKIDVMWFNEYEFPTHCFEVEHTTDSIAGMGRLSQLQFSSTASFFIVAEDKKRRKYESLLNRVQYRRIRDRFKFISYKELAELYEKAVPYYNLKAKILGE